MLVLSRKKGESIMIDKDIEIVVLKSEGDTVKIGIQAPKNVEILRKEIYENIQQSNTEAIAPSMDAEQFNAEQLNTLKKLFKNE